MEESTNKEYEKNMFANTLAPNYALTKFTLNRGVTDFSNLIQFDLYETGYSFLVLLSIPKFMDTLKAVNTSYRDLINTYQHIIEYEFRGCSGIDDMTSDTGSLTNGINELNVITKVNEQSASNFTMSYYERSGSIITKTHELYLRGIKDPRTQIKRYNGLINSAFNKVAVASGDSTDSSNSTIYGASAAGNYINEKGYHMEVFHFLLIITDNTGLNLEKAYLLASCQPTAANTNIYNVTRGEISFSELSLTYNGFPISGRIVNSKATKFIEWINDHTCFDEMSFGYDLLTNENLGDDQIKGRNGIYSPTIDKNLGTTNADKTAIGSAGYGSIYGYSPYSGNPAGGQNSSGSGQNLSGSGSWNSSNDSISGVTSTVNGGQQG